MDRAVKLLRSVPEHLRKKGTRVVVVANFPDKCRPGTVIHADERGCLVLPDVKEGRVPFAFGWAWSEVVLEDPKADT